MFSLQQKISWGQVSQVSQVNDIPSKTEASPDSARQAVVARKVSLHCQLTSQLGLSSQAPRQPSSMYGRFGQLLAPKSDCQTR